MIYEIKSRKSPTRVVNLNDKYTVHTYFQVNLSNIILVSARIELTLFTVAHMGLPVGLC